MTNRDFFRTPERVQALSKELSAWEGTPFRHRCGVKGLGVDCIHMVCHVLINLGAVPANIMRHVPGYPRDWHLHKRNTLLQDMIEKHLDVRQVPIAEMKDGDIVIYRFGRSNSHAAIYCGGKIYQAVEGSGVTRSSASDKQWNKRIRRVYRLGEGD